MQPLPLQSTQEERAMLETVNELAGDVQNTIKIVAVVAGMAVLLGAMVKAQGLSRIIIMAITIAIGIWLIAGGGVGWVAEQFGAELNG